MADQRHRLLQDLLERNDGWPGGQANESALEYDYMHDKTPNYVGDIPILDLHCGRHWECWQYICKYNDNLLA